MAFVHSKDTRVLLNEVAASGKLNSTTAANTRTLSESTVFTDDGERFVPGLKSGTLSLEGRFEDNTLFAELKAANGVDNSLLVSAAPGGFAVGKPVAMTLGDLASHTITSAVADVVGFSVEAPADEVIDLGVSLHDLIAEIATANGTSVDNAASSADGGVGVLHVTAASAADTLDAKIQHSTDNITYVDLITFTQAAAATSERKTVAGTVNRHVRAQWTIAGVTPSFTFVAAFARR